MTRNTDDDAVVKALNRRMVRVMLSHEQAVSIRNELASYTEASVWTNRYSGSDEFHITLSQRAGADLAQLLAQRKKRPTLKTFKAGLLAILKHSRKSKER